jgi:voltage-gated potassium channel
MPRTKRVSALERLHRNLDPVLVVLGFVWLALLVHDLIKGLTPAFEALGIAIWAVFVLDFVLELVLAPDRKAYLKSNWFSVIALLAPAFGIFRFLRVVRFLRSVRLVRLMATLNRSMKGLARSLGKRGFGYVVLLSLVVLFAGAAGMYAFERNAGPGFHSYSESMWWTAMVLTTMGSAEWPRTLEGRILCVLISLYAFAVFGYVTATLATYFVGDEAKRDASRETHELRREIAALREVLARHRQGG